MTTAELVALLQSKDPSGQMRVFMADENGEGLLQVVDDPEIREVDSMTIGNSPYNYTLSAANIGEKVLVL
jgi:hypothetical protein